MTYQHQQLPDARERGCPPFRRSNQTSQGHDGGVSLSRRYISLCRAMAFSVHGQRISHTYHEYKETGDDSLEQEPVSIVENYLSNFEMTRTLLSPREHWYLILSDFCVEIPRNDFGQDYNDVNANFNYHRHDTGIHTRLIPKV